ncbi:MAG: MBL fold metallo-hydrolase [Betaproteobacteria bacterium]|nr:MBL fold metallo-hydrolase [Betaproteobacteria bacterium]
MRFASLGSGSRGNALVVQCGASGVLVDCGFGLAEASARLARLGLTPQALTGILLTHEHGDHASGAIRLARKYALPIWATHGTVAALQAAYSDLPDFNLVDIHQRFRLGDIEIEPFPVPHDAREPVQYVLGDGARRLGVLTDAGCVTAHIGAVLRRCDALVLECNHDLGMLRGGSYPPTLKERISGRFGHLDNAAAASLLASLDQSRLQHVVAAHLSEENNTPELARAALAGALGCALEWVGCADQTAGFGWRQISA